MVIFAFADQGPVSLPWEVLLASALVFLLVVGGAGLLYLREWLVRRRFDSYRLGPESGGEMPASTGVTRKPLARNTGFTSGDPVDLRGMVARGGKALRPERSAGTTGGAGGGQRWGMLNVRAEDDLHELYLDGDFVGMAPASLRLQAGDHVLQVKRAGCKSYRREIRVIGGAEVSLLPVLHADTDKGRLEAGVGNQG